MNRAKKSQNSVLHTLERILTSRSSILNQDKGFRKASYLWRFDLLPILAKRIIFDIDDEIVNHELNLLLLYLSLSSAKFIYPGSGNGSSEHVRSGVPLHNSNFPPYFLL